MPADRNRSSTDKLNRNALVVLRPVKGEAPFSGKGVFFNSTPASSKLLNNPQFSDLVLQVGAESYYCHRCILSSASPVFESLLSGAWAEAQQKEIRLQEEEGCGGHFYKLLTYVYTGSVNIGQDSAIPLLLLADKYDIKALFRECAKVVKEGLKVHPIPSSFSQSYNDNDSSSDSDTDSSNTDSSPEVQPVNPVAGTSQSSKTGVSLFKGNIALMGYETFSLQEVCCLVDRPSLGATLHRLALYNLESRLLDQMRRGNFSIWQSLPFDIVIQILEDSQLSCSETLLFQAANSWLAQSEARKQMASRILPNIRFALMSNKELYAVEKDKAIQDCSEAKQAVYNAMKYKLFRRISASDPEWKQSVYQPRQLDISFLKWH